MEEMTIEVSARILRALEKAGFKVSSSNIDGDFYHAVLDDNSIMEMWINPDGMICRIMYSIINADITFEYEGEKCIAITNNDTKETVWLDTDENNNVILTTQKTEAELGLKLPL